MLIVVHVVKRIPLVKFDEGAAYKELLQHFGWHVLVKKRRYLPELFLHVDELDDCVRQVDCLLALVSRVLLFDKEGLVLVAVVAIIVVVTLLDDLNAFWKFSNISF